MPGFMTHYLFGVQNLKQLGRGANCGTLPARIAAHKTVFQLGLQGPDIFFYHPASQFKKVSPGAIVHEKGTGDFLKCLIQAPLLFWKEEDQKLAQAYAAGFIGHYVLDTQMHPYVYFRTGVGEELEKKGYADHIALETDIDACLLMRYAKCRPSEFPLGKTIAFGVHARSVVASVLNYAYNMVFPELKLTKNFLWRAVLAMQVGTMLTYNPHNYKRQVMGRAERLLLGRLAVSTVIPSDGMQSSEDPLNLQNSQWHNPWNPADCTCSSVPQMIKKASARYQKALQQLGSLYDAEPSEEQYDILLAKLCGMLGQKSFHSGLAWECGE